MEPKRKDSSNTSDDHIIVIDDDDDDDDEEEEEEGEDVDCEITGWNFTKPPQPPSVDLKPERLASCVSLLELGDASLPKAMTEPPEADCTAARPGSPPQFQTPDYNPRPRNSCPARQTSCALSPGHQRRQESLPNRVSSAFSQSVATSEASQQLGTATDPITFEIEANSQAGSKMPISGCAKDHSNSSGTSRRHSSISVEMLDAAPVVESPSQVESQDLVLERQISQTAHDLEVVDLDELEDDLADELRILEVQNLHPEGDEPQATAKPAKEPKLVRRNPSISEPWTLSPSLQHENVLLKPNKTVEMLDGDFLRITQILCNSETTETRLRGNRLQRTRDLNGLLERKMNEVVLFLEVDLDDPRPHSEQSAIEIPLTDIRKIRSLRLTNQKFPLDRNMDSRDFRNRDHINLEGGLTCRWKYTCIYATETDRYNNIPKERRLERLRQDECTSANALSDTERRFHWRDGTVPGGAYRPTLAAGDPVPPAALEQPAILIDDPPSPSSVLLAVHNSVPLNSSPRKPSIPHIFQRPRTEKRKHSSDDESMSSNDGRERQKRLRPNSEAAVEDTRQRLATTTLQKVIKGLNIDSPTAVEEVASINAELETFDSPTGKSQPIDLSGDTRTSISEPINLISSNLSTPPPSGSLQLVPLKTPKAIHRLPGQKLTYGDAFCGGGGSTRGALMAGLHIKWGFDFNKHACATWAANFPSARNYHASAHDFISRVQNSSQRSSFKVDILHLSPPCQFFSPAHTCDGKDDEMNVASLFAVQSVIDVARPRVVTLEQTFGIVNERFRWFFNALVQMFTSHDLSVRWAVIPLQGWGLPQRRMRLIIIAACPGEVLPRMPQPTHAENPPKGSTLRQHTSVDSILSSIPITAPDHDPESVIFASDKTLHPWDSTKILPRAMTTSGGQNYHPSGARDFTLREYACLQGFPHCHLFRGNCIKKQIGNAVPPIVAKVLFESIKRDLDRADGIVEDVEVLD